MHLQEEIQPYELNVTIYFFGSTAYFLAKLFSPSIMTRQLYVAVITECKNETSFCPFKHGWLDTGGEPTMLLSQLTRPSPTQLLNCHT